MFSSWSLKSTSAFALERRTFGKGLCLSKPRLRPLRERNLQLLIRFHCLRFPGLPKSLLKRKLPGKECSQEERYKIKDKRYFGALFHYLLEASFYRAKSLPPFFTSFPGLTELLSLPGIVRIRSFCPAKPPALAYASFPIYCPGFYGVESFSF